MHRDVMVQWWHLTFSLLRFPFYYCTCTDSRGTNMLLWERECPLYVERKYNSLHKFLSLHTYITDSKQIQWFAIKFFGPSMPIIMRNPVVQESWSAPKCLMGKRTKNLFLDMKKWVRKEVKNSSGTSKIDLLLLVVLLRLL